MGNCCEGLQDGAEFATEYTKAPFTLETPELAELKADVEAAMKQVALEIQQRGAASNEPFSAIG